VIYNLNGDVHWELSRDLMREVITIVDDRLGITKYDAKMIAELLNLRNTLQSELDRTEPAETSRSGAAGKLAMDGPADNGAKDGRASLADNTDLI
jgi:hypothetical protein